MEEKRIAFTIQDNKSFFADEVSITNNPIRFILDFKNTSPRIDIRAEQGIPMVVDHNTILMDVWLAKRFSKLLSDHIKKYESEFGTIKEPEQVKAVRKKQKHHVTSTHDKPPAYFG